MQIEQVVAVSCIRPAIYQTTNYTYTSDILCLQATWQFNNAMCILLQDSVGVAHDRIIELRWDRMREVDVNAL